MVDGDWRMRKLIRANLEAMGFQVGEAGDGQACLQALRAQSWDLILLGAELPDANGWNIVRQLRSEAGGSQVPIVVTVAEPADERLLRRFARLSTLLKPFSVLTLLESVDRALHGGGAGAID